MGDDIATHIGENMTMRTRALLCVLSLCVLGVLVGLGEGRAQPAELARATAWCQGSQAWQSVRRHLGVPIRVNARVASVHYASSSNGRPTFINLGNRYPNANRVTVLIWGQNRRNFPRAPERMFRRGQTICVQGVAEMYRGSPEIEVSLWDPASHMLSF
ncbi:MAG: hypothetical protein ACR2LG_09685 [Actinomycetota bacterium]